MALWNQTLRENVVRNIWTLIQKIWYCGDREELMELAGRCLEKPPTCNEFIGILEDFLKRKEGRA